MPPTQWDEEHCSSRVQSVPFSLGRAQVPLLQKFPVPHWALVVQVPTQAPVLTLHTAPRWVETVSEQSAFEPQRPQYPLGEQYGAEVRHFTETPV